MLSFIGIGVARCGTTWTSNNLKQHPNLFMPVKEARYFMYEDYRHVVASMMEKRHLTVRRMGEWTPAYFIKADYLVRRIYSYNPHMKILINLRNPVDRAWSWFNLRIAKGKAAPTDDFIKLFESPDINNHYRQPGYYTNYLDKWFQWFPRENIKVSIFEQFVKKPVQHLNDCARFLGVPAHYTAGNMAPGGGGKAKKLPLPDDIRAYLQDHYKDHIAATKEFLKVDLPW